MTEDLLDHVGNEKPHFLRKVGIFTTYGNFSCLSTENFVGKKQQGNRKNIIDFLPSIFNKKRDYKQTRANLKHV